LTAPTPLIRTLDQEVLALLRGASLECLVCGEFVQHRLGLIACPECGAAIQEGVEARVQSKLQAG
jgi:Zn finger protein HypA/HybF involved in hydrogenase expression